MMGKLFLLFIVGSVQETKVQALLQAKLTVSSSRITETDSVTLSCQAPERVSVHQCRFYVNGGTQRSFPCKNTFTGTELLLMSEQSSPSVVSVRCYYTVLYGAVESPSPHSDKSNIIIDVKPQLAVHYYKGQFAVFTCSLPGSGKHGTACNLYIGESSHPVKTTANVKKNSRLNQWSCQTEIPEDELLRYLHVDQQKEVSCDYTLESEEKSLTTRSDPYSFAVYINTDHPKPRTFEKSCTFKDTLSIHVAIFRFTVNVEKVSSSVPSSHGVGTGKKEDLNAKDKNKEMWKLIIAATVSGLTVLSFLMIAACLIVKRKTEKELNKRKKPQHSTVSSVPDTTEMLPEIKDGVYGTIPSGPDTDYPTDPGECATKKLKDDDLSIYHVYCTIPDLPPSSTKDNEIYSLSQ